MSDTEPELRWHATYAVASPAQKSSGPLRGDKILLPQSALEQLLAAAPMPAITNSTFTSRDPFNPYASQQFNSFRETSQLPNPLMFRLVNPDNGNSVYAGIREFSAEEGEVVLSSYLLDALGIQSTDEKLQSQVTVHAKQLPRGTFVRLRPLEAGYNPDDWKSLLERQLRESFTTLTKESVLSVQGVRGEKFDFLVDKILPEGEEGICVVDTDLEVDIEALNEEQARETLRQIMAKSQAGTEGGGSSKGGPIDIWRSMDGQVVAGEYVDYELPSWNKNQPLTVELSGFEPPEALDLFISPFSTRQRALPRDSEHVFGNFTTARDGAKSIITIHPTNVELEHAEKILISVHAYLPPGSSKQQASRATTTFTVRARSESNPSTGDERMDTSPSDSEHHHPSTDEQCSNCLQWVPKQTMVLHQNFCLRNNVVCPKCRSVFKKSSPEWQAHWHCEHDDDEFGNSPESKAKHDSVRHQEVTCLSCDSQLPSLVELALHRTTVCPSKLILCRFCHLEVPQEGDPLNPSAEMLLSGLTAHELADGTRTTDCHLCGKIIRMRDMEAHMKHHELDKVSRPKPAICRNVNCGRTLHGVGPSGAVGAGTWMGQGPGNDLGLCSLCFGPLYVSMHDPDGKALRRRIERRYLTQMMTGCGKASCANEWCRTGRANTGLEAKGSNSAQAALSVVKPLVEGASQRAEPIYFCTDETSQKRRKMAEMLAAENAWELEWCVAAFEAASASGNLDKAREWLRDWAPTKTTTATTEG